MAKRLTAKTVAPPLHVRDEPNHESVRVDLRGVATPRRSDGRDRTPLGTEPPKSLVRLSFALGLNR